MLKNDGKAASISSQVESGKLADVVSRLSAWSSLEGICLQGEGGAVLPSGESLQELVGLLRAILFPGYYGRSKVDRQTVSFHIGVNVERFEKLLREQILAGFRFDSPCGCTEETNLRDRASDLSWRVVERLPALRKILSTDVKAAYEGDPAAVSYGEVILCYPVLKALTNYRLAHELYVLGVPLIPRMLTEMAHSETGIDIHPGASIGEYFSIDHGTGVVIGATCVIGNHVKLYQGVTLGAKSFPLDEDGRPIKGIPRHPILGDRVIVYANATILGRIKIGDDCVVGANVWVTEDLEEKTKKLKISQIEN